jgi:hypothetical protein
MAEFLPEAEILEEIAGRGLAQATAPYTAAPIRAARALWRGRVKAINPVPTFLGAGGMVRDPVIR